MACRDHLSNDLERDVNVVEDTGFERFGLFVRYAVCQVEAAARDELGATVGIDVAEAHESEGTGLVRGDSKMDDGVANDSSISFERRAGKAQRPLVVG